MKLGKLSVLLLASVTMLSSCGKASNTPNPKDVVNVQVNENTNEIGAFSLITPLNNVAVEQLPEFRWEAAQNATSYTFEFASDETFNVEDDTYYYKKVGLSSTSYTLNSSIKNKDKTYYWRVTANNEGKKTSKKASNVGSFFYRAPDIDQIEFDVAYADSWTVHEQGSYADISIDNTNFFGNNKPAVRVAFDEAHTNQGIPSSDGWIVITQTKEVEMYGVDSIFMNFYYAGQDSEVWVRMIDEDNEYWNAKIQLANNAKQNIIIKFSDFTLRTKGGTTIANQIFDYNYIRGIEFVFEKTFGDGVMMFSDLKAVKFANYGHLFVDRLDFNALGKDNFTTENYVFTTNIKDNGDTLNISYGSDINGYGLVKCPVNKNLVPGNAFKFKINYNKSNTGARFLLRLIEEDGDRWFIRQKASTLPTDGYLVIPFNAFTLSEYKGNGAREFYFIKQFQFGIENNYQAGEFEISDFHVCYLEDEVENLYVKTLGSDGMIENFDEYPNDVNLYYKWQLTDTNKDEQMAIDNKYATGSQNNNGKFGYKSDMGDAGYGVRFDGVEGYEAFSFESMDLSLKNSDAKYNHLSDVSAKLTATIYVTDGATYSYVINALSHTWTRYTINFASFKLDEGFYDAAPLESANVLGIALRLQYYYYDAQGKPSPAYTSNNFVYFDNIKLCNGATEVVEVQYRIKPSTTESNTAVVDDFERYSSSAYEGWAQTALSYSELTLENDGNNYMKMKYQGATSVSYSSALLVDSSVNFAKAVQLDLKGDDVATVYFNIYMVYAGSSYKYRATLKNVASSWNRYTIGFSIDSNFAVVEGNKLALNKDKVPYITKISFGIVNSTGVASYVYVDNIKFVNASSYGVNTVESVVR